MSWHLLVYGTRGRCLVREVDGEVTVGRSHSDLNLPNPNVTRRHCVFLEKNEQLWIADSVSSGGTYVNDRKIGRAPTRLRVGDRVRIGDARIVVDDRYPGAWVAQDALPEHGAPIGRRLVVGDWGSAVDFVMPKGRTQQGRAHAEILRTDTGYVIGDVLDASSLTDAATLSDRDRIRIGDRGVLRVRIGTPPSETQHAVFRESPLASLAEMLVAPDAAYREQAASLLDALLSSAHAAEVMRRLTLSERVGPSFSHQVRPPRLRLDDEGLVGPLRSAFEMIALHLLAASEHPLRGQIESLWVGFVAPPPWWDRTDVAEAPPRLDVDLTPLAALPNLHELFVENATRISGPPLPSVRSVRLIGCGEVEDYKALFPNVVRWDAHRPIGFDSTD